MYATAIVDGKIVRFKLSPGLAKAHRENAAKRMTDAEVISLIEKLRHERVLTRKTRQAA